MFKSILITILISCYIKGAAFAPIDTMKLYNYRQFHFSYSNDLYHSTDRYLTQLAYFKYITPWQNKHQNEFTVQQNVYTPSDIFGDTVQKNDRPYTSLLFASYKMTRLLTEHHLLLSGQLSIGSLGKYGLGEQTQREIHYAVNSRQALGWQYQLANAPLINTQVGLDKGLIVQNNFEYILGGQLNAGTVFNDVAVAQIIRVHVGNSFFPYLNTSKLKSFRFALTMRNELKLIRYNGTLQGGIGSRHNIYTLTQKQITPLVYYQQIGLHLAYQRLGITYSESYISKEFKTGFTHKWSTVLFSYLF